MRQLLIFLLQLAGHINIKYNRMRDRLRSRLNEKRSNAVKENTAPNKIVANPVQPKVKKEKEVSQPVEPTKAESVPDTRDIKDLLNFIEGVDTKQKEISAKNAAKKQKRLEKKVRNSDSSLLQFYHKFFSYERSKKRKRRSGGSRKS